MITNEIALKKRKCNLCGRTIKKGEVCVRFFFSHARFYKVENLCVLCMHDMYNDYRRSLKNE